MITPEQRAEARRLFYAEHWKVGTIAAALMLHHQTVQLAIESDRFVSRGAGRVVASVLDPYKALIRDTLVQHPRLRSTRLFEMLRARGYTGGVVVVRRFVSTMRPRPRAEAFLRLDTLPGEQAQVDWGHFGRFRIGHAERALSCFVMVLSWSRAMYARFTLDQTIESFLRCHVEAFEALGGAPRVVLYDNLKSVVLERSGDHVRFHSRILDLAGHHHFAPRPCAPYRGNEKGKVERTIQYLRHGFFAARRFSTVKDLNEQLAHWIEDIAHARPVPGDPARTLVRDALLEERPTLLALPEHRFETDLVLPTASGKRPYVRFDPNDYSIPHELVRKPLTLVVSEHVVRVLDGASEVARHLRTYDRGRVVEAPEHLAALSREKRAAHELRGRDRLRAMCTHADAMLAELARRGDPVTRHATHLTRLIDLYGAADVDACIALAMERGAISAESVAHLCDQRRRARRGPPPVLLEHMDPRVRDLRVTPHDLDAYDALGASKQDR